MHFGLVLAIYLTVICPIFLFLNLLVPFSVTPQHSPPGTYICDIEYRAFISTKQFFYTLAGTLYLISASLKDAKKSKGYRASIYKCAQDCIAYYSPNGEDKSIFYAEGSADLQIHLSFLDRTEARIFQNKLLDFGFMHPHFNEKLVISEEIPIINVIDLPRRIFYQHYHPMDNHESPDMSLNDILSVSDSIASLSSDPSLSLQAVEDPVVINSFGSKWYRCHLISRKVRQYKYDPDNVIYASGIFHQLFDGSNTTGRNSIPLVGIRFDHFGDLKEVQVGDKFELRQELFVVIQFANPDLARSMEAWLKIGTTRRNDCSFDSFLYARNGENMKYFLEQKYIAFDAQNISADDSDIE